MSGQNVMRRWTGVIRTADVDEYIDYIRGTGLADYVATPGNLGAQMLMRDLGDGRTEVATVSWWRSIEDIEAFAGTPIDLARYYPADDRFLLERPERVDHFRVVAVAGDGHG